MRGHEAWTGSTGPPDEFTPRAKDSGVKYLRNVFPLIELGWDRAQCADNLAERAHREILYRSKTHRRSSGSVLVLVD